MVLTETPIVLNEDRVFFTRDIADFEVFSSDFSFDGFLKTLLNRIREGSDHIQIVVLVPVRKLAQQMTQAIKKYAEPMSVKVHACAGGTSVREENLALLSAPHIVIGTPGRVKYMISSGFLLLNALDLFIMYNFRPLLGKYFKEALSSIVTSLPEDIQKGKCICTSSRPHGQRRMEQFCKEMSLCDFYGVSNNSLLEPDVPTHESGMDDGGEATDDGGETMEEPLGDKPDQAISFAHTRYIMAAVQSVNVEMKTVQVLVIAPKAEEVKQISEELRDSLSRTKILVYGCCGQTNLRDDSYVLSNGVHVLITPPRRACRLLRRKCINTKNIRVLIMVKAEKPFCGCYETLLQAIIQAMPRHVQCVLLSGKALIHASEADANAISPHEESAPSEPREPVINPRRHISIEVQDDQTTERTRDFWGKNVAAKKTQFEVLCDLYPKLEYERTVIICNWPKKAAWIQEHLAARGYHVVCLVGMKTKEFEEEMQKLFESALFGVILITETSASLFKDKEISVIVNYEMPRSAKGYVGRVAATDIERERTVVNLIRIEREAKLMETVQSQYGISIEHFINPHCIKF